MGGKNAQAANSQQIQKLYGIQIQTSTAGVCIPICIGTNRGAPNIIWYNNFQATPANKGGKGGGKNTQYDYSAAVILAVGEGPLHDLSYITSSGTNTTLEAINCYFINGTATQAPQAYVEDNYPSQALAYPSTAYIISEMLDLGSSATVPSISYTYTGFLYQEVNSWADAKISSAIKLIVESPQFGLDMPSSVFSSANYAWADSYYQAQKLLISPYLATQEQVTSIFDRWAKLGNCWIYWDGNFIRFRPLGTSNISANGATYTAVNTPVVDLNVTDLIFDAESDEDPYTVTIIDPSDGYNTVEIDFNDSQNGWNTNPAYFRDQASIDQYGVLQSQVINATEVTQPDIASTMVSLLGQRTVNIRNNYNLKLPQRFIFLEVGDVITLTDPNVNLNRFAMMITSCQEGEDFVLTIDAEEFPAGSGIPADMELTSGTGNTGDNGQTASPGNINTPVIFQPDTSLTGGSNEVWLGASGNGTSWGGCQVWASTDNSNYLQVGQINSPTIQGTLTGSLSSTSSGSTATLSLDVSECEGTVPVATENSYANLQTIVLVDEELIAWAATSLTDTYHYTLSVLDRGVYDTNAAAHANGDPIAVVNPGAVLKMPLLSQYADVELYFKFPSFNLFGGELQALSDVDAYTFTPTNVDGYAPSLVASLAANPLNLAAGLNWVNGPIGLYEGTEYGPPTSYLIYQIRHDDLSPWNGDGSLVQYTIAAPATSFVATNGLEAGVEYDFYVIPDNAVGSSDTFASGTGEPEHSVTATCTPVSTSGTGGGSGVTQVATSGVLTGGPITTTGTISLSAAPAWNILANNGTATAAPSYVEFSDFLNDYVGGESPGQLLAENGSGTWTGLEAGGNGTVLTTVIVEDVPTLQWQTPGGGSGGVSFSVAAGLSILDTGGGDGPVSNGQTITTSFGTLGTVMGQVDNMDAPLIPQPLTAMLDTLTVGYGGAATQGMFMYRYGSTWSFFPAPTAPGQVIISNNSTLPVWGSGLFAVGNIGTGEPVYASTVSGTAQLRSIIGLEGIVVGLSGNVITIGLAGPAITSNGTTITVNGQTLTQG